MTKLITPLALAFASLARSPQDGGSVPDAEPGEKKRGKVSNRIVLGPDREEADSYMGAYGAKYESLSEPGAIAEVLFKPLASNARDNDKLLPEEAIFALAAFGFTTLAGNVTNTIRNGTVKTGGPTTEKEALDEWLAELFAGNWTKTSGEVEPGLGLLAEAVARTLSDNDRKDRSSPESIAKVKDWLAGLDKDARKTWRNDLRVKRHQAAIQAERAAKRLESAATPAPMPEAPADI